MPVAIRNTDTKRVDLKTLPDAFVVLRRMTYGQILQRRSLVKLTFSSSKGKKDLGGEMAMANRVVNIFEFQHCIVEHNLERTEGVLLNLSSEADIDALDPQVGQEIEKAIEEMNNFDGDDDEGNSTGESKPQSS